MRRVLLTCALLLSATLGQAQPVRPAPSWLRLYLPIRPQLVPGGFGGGSSSGTSNPALNTVQTPDTYYFSTDPLGNSLIIGEAADATFDSAIPQQTDPALIVKSHNQSTTQWLSLSHNGTLATIGTGAGNIMLTNGGQNVAVFAQAGLTMSSGYFLGFNSTSGDANGSAIDIGLRRLSAGVLTQRAGTATSVGSLMGGGTTVASADPLPVPTGLVFHVSGTTSFTNITTTNMISGACFTMIFDGILTITDGGNLKLTGNYTTSADDTLTVCFDGTSYFEVARAVN